eukprot:scaffold90511_cov25-Tisochrysis_lutea.AAC.1
MHAHINTSQLTRWTACGCQQRAQRCAAHGNEPSLKQTYTLPFLELTGGRRVATYKELSAAQLMAMSPEEELDAKVDETDFGAAMCCLSILRCVRPSGGTMSAGAFTLVSDDAFALAQGRGSPRLCRAVGNVQCSEGCEGRNVQGVMCSEGYGVWVLLILDVSKVPE